MIEQLFVNTCFIDKVRACLQATGRVMQKMNFSVCLETRADIKPFLVLTQAAGLAEGYEYVQLL